MNPLQEQILSVFGVLFTLVVVVLMIPYLTPYAGSASSGLVSTGTEYNNIFPFIGLLVVGMSALLAMEGYRRKK